MALTFLQLAEIILQEEKLPLTYTEIWKIAVDKKKDDLVETKGKSPWQTLGARLYVDVRDNPNSIFIPIGKNPKRFILKSQQGTVQIEVTEPGKPTTIDTTKSPYQEKDLHPLMVYYGSYYLKAYLKTIHHNLSNKKGYGEWVHPDIVGCYFPFNDWNSNVVEVSNLMGNSAITLYSFELKKELSFSNLRESFFQAVSNSSWANEGYLVAAEIEKDDEFMNELKRLSSAFGIGVIELNIEDPDACTTLLPASTRDMVDWDTVNKLASMNSDFMNFLKRIKNDISSKEIIKEKYDAVLEKEDIIKIYQKK